MATNPSSLEWRMVLLGSGLMVGAFMAAAKYAGGRVCGVWVRE